MLELYRGSVQKVPFQRCRYQCCTSVTLELPRGPVKCVTCNRMAGRGQVHTDLMRPSRFDPHLQQGKLAVRAFNLLCNLPMCDGLAPWPALATTARGHARAADWITADGRVDRSFCCFHPAVHQRDVCLLYLAPRELFRQLSVGYVRLGHQHQAAGFLVQTMHDSRPQLSANL